MGCEPCIIVIERTVSYDPLANQVVQNIPRIEAVECFIDILLGPASQKGWPNLSADIRNIEWLMPFPQRGGSVKIGPEFVTADEVNGWPTKELWSVKSILGEPNVPSKTQPNG